jgi:hypothetical protein
MYQLLAIIFLIVLTVTLNAQGQSLAKVDGIVMPGDSLININDKLLLSEDDVVQWAINNGILTSGDVERTLSQFNLSTASSKDSMADKIVELGQTTIELSASTISYTGEERSPTNFQDYHYQSAVFTTGLDNDILPIGVSGRIAYINNTYQSDISNLSVQFDHQSFLQRVKRKYANKIKRNIDVNVVNEFTAKENVILKEEVRFQLLQRIMASPEYEKLIIREKRRLSDTLTHVVEKVTEDAPNRIKKDSADYKQLVILSQEYRSQWEKRQAYYGEPLNELNEKIETQSIQISEFNDPDRLKSAILKSKDLPFLTKVLAATEDFGVGNSTIDGNWYTAQQFPVRGLKYGVNLGGLYAEVNYGKQVYNNFTNPLWGSSLFREVGSGPILFVKGGGEFGKGHSFEFNYLSVNNREKQRQNPFFPKRNSVFSLTNTSGISNSMYVTSTIAYAKNDWNNSYLEGEDVFRNLAGDVSLAANFFEDLLNVSAGYYYVGPDYFTVANPFLLNDQQGVRASAKGSIGDKIKISGEGRIGVSLDDNATTKGENRSLQFIGSISYKITSWLEITGQVSPNTFKQYGTGQVALSNDNFIYNCQVSMHGKVGGSTLLSYGGISNYSTHTNYLDTAWMNNSSSIYNQSSLILKNGNRFTWLVSRTTSGSPVDDQNVEENETKKFKSFISRADYSFGVGKARLSLGIEWTEDGFLLQKMYGANIGFQWALSSKINLFTSANLQIPMKWETENKPSSRFVGQTKFIQSF